jgi:predicted dehydrogenase
MQHHSVKSSAISSIGYDRDTKTMEVQFTNGTLYVYSDVSPEHFTAFHNADSIGRHFAANISGKFPHQKIQVDE